MSKKYSKNTIMSLLKIMLLTRTDISEEEKNNIIKLAETLIADSERKNEDHENKQTLPIADYKRRN